MNGINEMYNQQDDTELTLHLLSEPTRRPFGDGWTWIQQSYLILKSKFGKWLLMGLTYLACVAVMGMVMGFIQSIAQNVVIDWIVNILSNFVMTGLTAGIVIAIASAVEEDDLAVKYLFSGLQYKAKDCFIYSVLLMICAVILAIIMGLMISPNIDFSEIMTLSSTSTISGNSDALGKYALIALLVPVLTAMLAWFALPLIVLHDVPPLRAMKMSLVGSLKNILPAIAYGFLMIALMLGCMMVMALGMTLFVGVFGMSKTVFTVLIAIFMLAAIGISSALNVIMLYVSYRNIWTNLPLE